MYFDDVKVPWERAVRLSRSPTCAARSFTTRQGHAYQNYQAQIRLSVKITFLAGLARRVTEAIGTTNIPSVARAARHAGGAGRHGRTRCCPAWRPPARRFGEWYVPNKHFMYSAQVLTQDLYPRVINTIRELAGGALIMLPSSVRDFGNPEMTAIINKTQRSAHDGRRRRR